MRDGPYRELSLSSLTFPGGGSWNDRISSIQMIDMRAPNPVEVYNAPPGCASKSIVFKDWYFQGTSLEITSNIADLNVNQMNDAISSLCVAAGTTLTLWEDVNFTGSNLSISGPRFIQNLAFYGWNDKVSSIQVGGPPSSPPSSTSACATGAHCCATSPTTGRCTACIPSTDPCPSVSTHQHP